MTRTAFFGTPPEAVPILAAAMQVSDVGVVVTQPDRRRGRGLRPAPSAVKSAAERWGVAVLHPEGAGGLAEAVAGCEVALVAAYGRLIPAEVLAEPSHGFLNVHFSLLPRWRGASPVVRAILAGDDETGVTLITMDEGLDTGPIVASRAIGIRDGDTGGTLTARLAGVGAGLVVDHLDDYAAGRLSAMPQEDSLATAAGKVTVEEAFLDPERHSADAVTRAVRAFSPWPGSWGVVDGARIKVLAAAPADQGGVEAGTAVVEAGRVLLGAVGGSVELLEVQPEGRPAMSAAAWMNGRRGEPATFSRPA